MNCRGDCNQGREICPHPQYCAQPFDAADVAIGWVIRIIAIFCFIVIGVWLGTLSEMR